MPKELRLDPVPEVEEIQDIVEKSATQSSTEDNSKAECLLLFFKQRKEHIAQELNGTFFIVIYHKKSHELILINDRLGQTRIYYTDVQDKFIFSSKAKAILPHEDVVLKVNETSVLDRFLFRSRCVSDVVHTRLRGVGRSRLRGDAS